jgi:hypothetical protein
MNHWPDSLRAAVNDSFPGESATYTTLSSSPRLLSPEQFDSSSIINVSATLELTTELPAAAINREEFPGQPREMSAWDRLTQMCRQKLAELPPCQPRPLPGESWNILEYQAISAALGTPDLFLLDSSDPELSGRLLEQALSGAGSVLIIGCSSTALTRLAEKLAATHPRRLAFAGDRPDTGSDHPSHLPVPILKSLISTIQQAALQPYHDAESRAVRQQQLCDQALELLDRFREEYPDLSTLEVQIEELRRASEHLQDNLLREAASPGDSPFSRRLESLRRTWQEERLGIEAAIRETQDALAHHEKQRDRLLYESRSNRDLARQRVFGLIKGWFTSASATATLEHSLHHQEIEKTCQELQDTLERLQAELSAIDHRYEEQRQVLCNEEATARASRLRETLQRLTERQEQAYDRLRMIRQAIAPLELPEWQVACPDSARLQLWRKELQHRREQAQAAQHAAIQNRQDLLGHLAPQLRQGLSEIRGVFATLADLSDSAMTYLNLTGSRLFDLVVVIDAEHMTEVDGQRALELGSRAILIGNLETTCTCGSIPSCTNLQKHSWFSELWQVLHPREWRREGYSLVACLTEPDKHHRLWTEPLADRPEILLHFSEAANGHDVRLYAIRFPPEMTMCEARKFLAHELGDLRLNPLGIPTITESEDQIVFAWCPVGVNVPMTEQVELQPGVSEEMISDPDGHRTVVVRMKKTAGWTRDLARTWVEEQTQIARRIRSARIHSIDSRRKTCPA